MTKLEDIRQQVDIVTANYLDRIIRHTEEALRFEMDSLAFDLMHTPEENIPHLIDLFAQGQIEMLEFEERVKRLL